MAWLSRAGLGSSYLSAVALPMVLIGTGQGLAFAPMTSAGLAGVDGSDAGAASGLINTFRQLGSALGLGILVAVGAAAVPAGAPATAALADRVSTALTSGSIVLAAALALTIVLIAPQRLPARRPASQADRVQGVRSGKGTPGLRTKEIGSPPEPWTWPRHWNSCVDWPNRKGRSGIVRHCRWELPRASVDIVLQ